MFENFLPLHTQKPRRLGRRNAAINIKKIVVFTVGIQICGQHTAIFACAVAFHALQDQRTRAVAK